MANDQEDNENANNQEFSNKKATGGGDAYTKMVTKVEKIKVWLDLLIKSNNLFITD